MKFKNIFLGAIVIYFVFGLAFTFFPEFAIMRFSNDSVISTSTQFIIRFWGAAFLGLGTSLLIALKSSPDNIALRALYIGHFIHLALGFFITIADVIWSSPKPTMWIMIVVWGIFAILFGRLVFQKKA